MFVIDKNYVIEINKKIPFDIRHDFAIKNKTLIDGLPVNRNVSKSNKYIEIGIGIETLLLQIYVVHAIEEYIGLILDDNNKLSLAEYVPNVDSVNLGDVFGELPNKAIKVEMLYDDSKKETINKIAFIFTLPPNEVPENVTFFIKNELIKDIKKGKFKDKGWVTQYME